MSKFYDELAALDRGIADRWKRRARDNPRRRLGPKDAEVILDPLIKPNATISEKQTQAIAKMVLDGEWTNEGLATIQVYIKVGVQLGFFQNGGDVLVTPDEFRPVTHALGAGMTGKIAFKSPGSNFSYVPGHYQAIYDLVSKSKIFVLEVRLHSLEKFARVQTMGQYRSDSNYLYIFAGRTLAETAMTIVHEVTHAIQDWQDVSAKNKYVEADAFIAGGFLTGFAMILLGLERVMWADGQAAAVAGLIIAGASVMGLSLAAGLAPSIPFQIALPTS